MSFLTFLHKVVSRENLTAAEAQTAMQLILEGQASTSQIAAFLVGARMKGETPEELLGFARAMRRCAVTISPVANGEALVRSPAATVMVFDWPSRNDRIAVAR